MTKVGRNEPCPCGSGAKYKKCCGSVDASPQDGAEVQQGAAPDAERIRRLGGALNGAVVEHLGHFAAQRLGPGWYERERARLELDDAPMIEGILVPLLYYSVPVGGQKAPIAALAILDGLRFTVEQLEWIDAQTSGWTSIFRVLDVTPGVSVRLEDVLSGEERLVHEKSGTQSLSRHDTILAGVTDFRTISLFVGLHPRVLPPRLGEQTAAEIRAILRKRNKPIPLDALCTPAIAVELLARWETSVTELDEQPMPTLCNMDGDPLLFTKDRYDVSEGARPELERALGALEGVEIERDGEASMFRVERPAKQKLSPMDTVSVASGRITDRELVVETNSIARADVARRMIEKAGGGGVRHRIREHSDPAAVLSEARGERPEPEPMRDPPPEVAQALREMLDKHTKAWVDMSIPALGGKTPRQAVKTSAGRKEVEMLVREIEHREQRQPEWQRSDMAWLNKELGIGDRAEAARVSSPVVGLKVTLRGIRPAIWRRLRVRSDVTLGELHRVLQIAMGWTDSHMHQFCVGRQRYGMPDPDDGFGPATIDETTVRLDQIARVGSKLVYEYDFGDNWQHDIVVERAEVADEQGTDPVCVEGRRACPPEDCGGAYGYEELLAAVGSPKHPEHREKLDWVGPGWKPERFDLDVVNRRLQGSSGRRGAATGKRRG